jgi:hypothetical protein
MTYEWELLGNYGSGWDLLTTADTRKELNQLEQDYRANEPGLPLKRERVRANDRR